MKSKLRTIANSLTSGGKAAKVAPAAKGVRALKGVYGEKRQKRIKP